MQLFKVFLPTCSAFYLLLVTLQFFKPLLLILSNSVFAVKINLIKSFVVHVLHFNKDLADNPSSPVKGISVEAVQSLYGFRVSLGQRQSVR